MANIERIGTTPRMSKIVKHNGTVYLCGQVGDGESLQEQAETMLAKVVNLLEESGSDKEHMLSATIYLKDMKDFAAFNEIWDNWLIPGTQPARACVEAALARDILLCEISVVAALKG